MKYKTYKNGDYILKYDPITLLPYKPKSYKWLVIGLLFVIVIGLSTPIGSAHCSISRIFKRDIPKLTEQNLLDSLKSWNCYFPELVLKQMKIESGNFQSNIFKKTNNLIGMTYPAKRKTTAIGKFISGKYIYAVYDDWVQSAKDYLIFQQTYFGEKYYYQFLTNIGYAEDSSYINKIKK